MRPGKARTQRGSPFCLGFAKLMDVLAKRCQWGCMMTKDYTFKIEKKLNHRVRKFYFFRFLCAVFPKLSSSLKYKMNHHCLMTLYIFIMTTNNILYNFIEIF